MRPTPGTQEFALFAHELMLEKIKEMKEILGEENWNNHATLIFGCVSDIRRDWHRTTMEVNGNLQLAPAVIGIAIRELARNLQHHPKFVDCHGQQHKIVAKITKEVIDYAKYSALQK